MFKIAKSTAAKRSKSASEGLITWKVIETKMPWSLMFLLGGGFAISKGSVASSMARQIGNFLAPLRTLPPVLILAILCFFCGTLTEITSNVGVANITLPVIAQMVSSFSRTQRGKWRELQILYIFTPLPARASRWRYIRCIWWCRPRYRARFRSDYQLVRHRMRSYASRDIFQPSGWLPVAVYPGYTVG